MDYRLNKFTPAGKLAWQDDCEKIRSGMPLYEPSVEPVIVLPPVNLKSRPVLQMPDLTSIDLFDLSKLRIR